MEYLTKEEFNSFEFKKQLEYFKSLKRSERETFRIVLNLSERYMYEQYFPDEFKLIINSLKKTPEQLVKLEKNYKFNLRPNQLWPDEFTYWLVQAGRGFGKTRVGAEWVRWLVNVKGERYVNLCGATKNDAIDIMILGESGILNCCDDFDRPVFKNERLYWPNGAISLIFSAEEPERARGKQHSQLWLDEVGSWRYGIDMFDQLLFGLRLGESPQIVITTTPRTNELMRRLREDENTTITYGSTFDNKNLSKIFLNVVTKRFKGTKLGRQELNGEFLDKNENALFDPDFIDRNRVEDWELVINKDGQEIQQKRKYPIIVIGVDPSVTSTENSDETGIIVAGKAMNGEFYVLEDASFVAKPQDWSREIVRLYRKYNANHVIAESNQGGDLIEATLRTIDKNISYEKVWAKNSKRLRAEPITLLYEQDLVHHVGKADKEEDMFFQLERQMFNFTGDPKQKSPDRLDALVYALTYLSDGNGWSDLSDEFESSGKTIISDYIESVEKNNMLSKNNFNAHDFFNK